MNEILLTITLTTIKIQRVIDVSLNFEHSFGLRIFQALEKNSDFLQLYGVRDKYLEGRHFERCSSGANWPGIPCVETSVRLLKRRCGLQMKENTAYQ